MQSSSVVPHQYLFVMHVLKLNEQQPGPAVDALSAGGFTGLGSVSGFETGTGTGTARTGATTGARTGTRMGTGGITGLVTGDGGEAGAVSEMETARKKETRDLREMRNGIQHVFLTYFRHNSRTAPEVLCCHYSGREEYTYEARC